MFKFFLYKLGLFILKHLSLKSSYKFGVLLSDLQYFCSFRDRNAVKRNIRRILPECKDVDRIVREVFRNFGRYLVEFFKIDDMVNERFLEENVHLDGVNHLNDALAKGKGGIVVTAHIGNWEMGAIALSLLGYPMTAVALPHKERPVNDLFNRQREEKGVTIIPTNTAIRRCIEHLKENRIVALVADRDFGENGFCMDYLGYPMMTPKGPAIFSWKTGAPIIPVFFIRHHDGKFTLTCKEPVYPPKETVYSKGDNETLKTIIQKYLPIFEDQVRSTPDQWLMFRDFSEK